MGWFVTYYCAKVASCTIDKSGLDLRSIVKMNLKL